MKQLFNGLLMCSILGISASEVCSQTSFNYTGAMQTYTVPAGVTHLEYQIAGAAGGTGATGTSGAVGGAGGLGIVGAGIITVTPNESLNIFIGGQGGAPTGGFNGGGNGGNQNAGGGGGASDIRRGGTATSDRILVAAGGGGGGAGGCTPAVAVGGNGGNGGANGSNGVDAPTNNGNAGGGFGANGSTGGNAGIGCSGFLGFVGSNASGDQGGNGGNGQVCCCADVPGGGGGGGGLIGGGGGGGGSAGTVGCSGNDKGGGGGGAGGTSNLPSAFSTQANNSGNGYLTLCARPNIISASASNSNPCVGSTVTLSVNGVLGDAASWNWYDGNNNLVGSGSSLNLPVTADTDTFIVRAVGGCPSSSPMQVVIITPVSNFVNITTSNNGCEDITLSAQTVGAQQFQWSDGSSNGFVEILTPGNYTYSITATDTNGCQAADTINVDVFALPAVNISNDGQGGLSASAGFNSYQWFELVNGSAVLINGANTNTYTTPRVGGMFGVLVTDSNGCEGSSMVTVVGVNEVSNLGLSIFPNPTTGFISLQGATIKSAQVFSLDGKLAASFGSNNSINIAHLPAGIYNLTVNTDRGSETIRIVKK